MTDEAMMWFILGGVALLVGAPILWMFVRRGLIKMGWRPKLSKLDELALNRDLRGYWERGLASQCIAGLFCISVFAGLLILSALHNAIDFRQPAILINGILNGIFGIGFLGRAVYQLMLGWDRASQSRLKNGMELHRESLIRRFGEETKS